MPIDYVKFQQSLDDGTAAEIIEGIGAMGAESLLEEQSDDRVWLELEPDERDKLTEMMKKYANENGYRLERDDDSCIIYNE